MPQPVGSIAIELTADLSRMVGGFNRGSLVVERFGRRTQNFAARYDRSMVRITGATVAATTAVRRFGALAATLGLGGGILSVAGLIRFADTFTRVQNQLKVAGLEGANLQRTFADLFAIAQRHGTAIEPLTTLYSRLAQAQKELGASGADLTRFTEGVALALRVQGGDAQSATGALLQLSQALGGAVVRAEEFNSINEGARPILQAVASGLEEAGGSVARLRNLVVEGKVSSAAFFRAFLAGMSELKAKAASATPTIAQGFTRLGNALTVLVGRLDAMAGASVGAGSGLAALADGIDALSSDEDKLRRMVELAERLLGAFIGLKTGRIFGPVGAVSGGVVGAFSPEIRRALGYDFSTPETTNVAGKADFGSISLREFSDRFGPAAVTPVSLSDFPVTPTATDVDDMADAWRRQDAAIRANTASLIGFGGNFDTISDRVAQVADISSSFFAGLAKDLAHGANLTDALTSAIGRLTDRLIDLAFEQLVLSIVQAFTGGAGGGILSAVGAGLFHRGGTVGQGGQPRRMVHPAIIATAPRLHGGLGSDEFAAVLERGEKVLTAQMARRWSDTTAGLSRIAAQGGMGGGGNVNINVDITEAPGTTADVRKRSDGGLDIIVRQIEGKLAQSVAGNGPLGRSIGNTFDVKRRRK